jgi:hypothetical protein
VIKSLTEGGITPMQEEVEGVGQLEKWEHPDKKHEVQYQFRISTEIIARPGFPPMTERRSKGTVQSVAGELLPEGEYRLYTDEEILKVKNAGLGIWVILAS